MKAIIITKLAVSILGCLIILDVKNLIAALKSENWLIRGKAALALGEIKDQRAVLPLIAALKDEDGSVRSAAAEALGEIKDRRAVEPLIVTLEDKNWAVGMSAATALGKIKDPRAVEPLILALRHKDSRYREYAASALREIDPNWQKSGEAKGAVPEFISALKDNDSGVREYAASVLREIDPNWQKSEEAKRAVPEFISALIDKDPDVREYAASTLTEIDPDWQETEEAEQAVPEFISALKDSDPAVQAGAAEALGIIADPRAVEPLIVTLKDENWAVGMSAAKALGKIKDPRVVEPLVNELWVMESVQELIASATKNPPSVGSLVGRETWRARQKVAWALGQIKDPRAVEPLIAALKVDLNIGVQQEAAEALGNIGKKAWEAIPILIDSLNKFAKADVRVDSLDSSMQQGAVGLAVGNGDRWTGGFLEFSDGSTGFWDPKSNKVYVVPPNLKKENAAAKALRMITGKDFGQDQEKWHSWWENEGYKVPRY